MRVLLAVKSADEERIDTCDTRLRSDRDTRSGQRGIGESVSQARPAYADS